MFSDNPNVSPGVVRCQLYNRHVALKVDYHKNQMDMLACVLVENNNLKTLAKTSKNPATQNQFIQEKFLSNAPARQLSIAMNKTSSFS